MYFLDPDQNLMKHTPGSNEAELMADLEGKFPRQFVSAAGHLFFTIRNSKYFDLHATDGSAAGTTLLLEGLGRRNNEPEFFVVGDKVLFSNYDSQSGHELWISDGTQEGTEQLFDVNPGETSSFPEVLADHGGYVYFSAEYQQEGRQLFRIDREEISLISSFEDIASSPLEVYPNPTVDFIQLSVPEEGLIENVKVFSADGKVVHQLHDFDSEQKINLQGLAPGIFFVTAEVDGVFYSGRFVKAE